MPILKTSISITRRHLASALANISQFKTLKGFSAAAVSLTPLKPIFEIVEANIVANTRLYANRS
jgi:hypothetical protein